MSQIVGRLAFTAHFGLSIVVKTELIFSEPEVTRHTVPMVEAYAIMAKAITCVRKTLHPTTTARKDLAIRPKAMFNGRIREFVGRVVDSEINERLRVLRVSRITSAPDKGQTLKKVILVFGVAEGHYDLASRLALKTAICIACNTDFLKGIK